MTRRPQVHQDVTGAGVEAADCSARRQVGDVGDSSDVDDCAMDERICEQRRVECRHQRRALPAGRDVAAPEIRHDGDVSMLGDPRRIVDLQRPALLRAVPHRLTMDAGRHQVVRRHAGHRAGVPDRFRIEVGKCIGRTCCPRDFIRARGLQGHQFIAQGRGKGDVGRTQCADRIAGLRGKRRHHGIDAIQTRSGHHAGKKLAVGRHGGPPRATPQRRGPRRALKSEVCVRPRLEALQVKASCNGCRDSNKRLACRLHRPAHR